MLEVRARGTTRVVVVRGEVDFTNCSFLADALSATARETTGAVYVDFSACRYMDSSCLSVLVRHRKAIGERLRIVVPAGTSLRRIFTICHLDDYLDVLDRLDDDVDDEVA